MSSSSVTTQRPTAPRDGATGPPPLHATRLADQTHSTEPPNRPTATPTLALPPAPIGDTLGSARRRYVEQYGLTLVMNTYLKLALLALSAVTVGLIVLTFRIHATAQHVKPLVIRIDDVGRATALADSVITYTPQAPELRYFLVQFVIAHYSRMRATVRQQYAESLYFLDGRLADALIEANKKANTIERFLTGGGEEIEVHVKNVTLDDLRQPPYRATVEFEKVYLAVATRTAVKREAYVAHLVFVLRDQVDNARIPINPLGLTITYFRDDQAFVTEPGQPPP